MHKLPFFLALRYFIPHKQTRNGSNALAVIGIAVGVMSLIATLGVMNGLQQSYITSMLELGSSHAIVHSEGLLNDSEYRLLDNTPAVRAAYAAVSLQTLIRSAYADYHMLSIEGVDNVHIEQDESFLKALGLTSGQFLAQKGEIILGSELAKSLGVNLGDTVYCLTIKPYTSQAYEQEMLVGGIFKSGFYNYDNTLSFIGLDDAIDYFALNKEIFYKVKLTHPYKDNQFIKTMQAELSYPIESWRDYNRAFFSALRMEKNIMVLLLSLIFLVVAVSIFQSRQRDIEERSEEIAFLRAMGANPAQIKQSFSLQGLYIGVSGSILGLFLGVLVSWRINAIFQTIENIANFFLERIGSFSRVSLLSGDSYYIKKIPTHISGHDIIITLFLAIFSAFLAAFLAAKQTTKNKPWEMLRNN